MMYESRLSGSAYWDALSNYDKYKLGKNLDFLSRKDILRTYLTAGLSGRTLCAAVLGVSYVQGVPSVLGVSEVLGLPGMLPLLLLLQVYKVYQVTRCTWCTSLRRDLTGG